MREGTKRVSPESVGVEGSPVRTWLLSRLETVGGEVRLTRSPLSGLGDEVNLEAVLLEHLERVERLGDEQARLVVAQGRVGRGNGDQSALGNGSGSHLGKVGCVVLCAESVCWFGEVKERERLGQNSGLVLCRCPSVTCPGSPDLRARVSGVRPGGARACGGASTP